jgi:sulfur-oxidizing protein SoxA
VALILILVDPTAHASEAPSEPRRSGYEFMSPATQAMQRDDTLNPGMLWVEQGAALWTQASGASQRSCAACHGEATTSMRGVAARYPAFDETQQRPLNLAQRINQCRQQQQQAAPWPLESQELLSLESFVALQSRGLALAPPADARLAPYVERGGQHYQQRIGQINLSCAHCHDQRWGQRLGGSIIPQAHATGYPVYRLEWQGLGSLQRRLRACMSAVRAQPYAPGSLELVELELYLTKKSHGMALQAPAVRP